MADQAADPIIQDVKRIVVGVDGSAASREALRWAARIAEGTEARIEAVIAWDYPTGYGWATPPIDWQPDIGAAKVLQDTLDQVFGERRPARLDAEVKYGSARAVLLEEAEHADLLIVGSRGHGGFAGLLLGSVSAACAEHAQCAVLVVHAERRRRTSRGDEEGGRSSDDDE